MKEVVVPETTTQTTQQDDGLIKIVTNVTIKQEEAGRVMAEEVK